MLNMTFSITVAWKVILNFINPNIWPLFSVRCNKVEHKYVDIKA